MLNEVTLELKSMIMQEGKRQKQVAGLLNEELNQIFQRLGLTIVDGAMISISSVKITPDLQRRIDLIKSVNQSPEAIAAKNAGVDISSWYRIYIMFSASDDRAPHPTQIHSAR